MSILLPVTNMVFILVFVLRKFESVRGQKWHSTPSAVVLVLETLSWTTKTLMSSQRTFSKIPLQACNALFEMSRMIDSWICSKIISALLLLSNCHFPQQYLFS